MLFGALLFVEHACPQKDAFIQRIPESSHVYKGENKGSLYA